MGKGDMIRGRRSRKIQRKNGTELKQKEEKKYKRNKTSKNK